jgi:hypothetical protein
MSHTTRSIFSLTVLCLTLFAASGCSVFDARPAPRGLKMSAKQRVFFANYDLVWRAAHAVIRYPIAVDNQDTGILETDYIKGVDGWLPPEANSAPSSGIRYKVILLFAKGKTDGRDSTRVTIEKRLEILRDFFSEPETFDSDGLEEKVLFYRIERELIVSEALKKAN